MKKIIAIVSVAVFTSLTVLAEGTVFDDLVKEAVVKDDVKEISYDQFKKLRDSKEEFYVLDVLGADSYAKGHIDGALNLPLDKINLDTANGLIPAGSKVVVYCGSFKCTASTESAKILQSYGYNVLDYKGGIKEWQEKGNKLVK